MMKRTLALLLALIMVVGLLPNTLVLAADANDDIYIDESSSLDEISLSEPQDLPDEGSSESGDPAVNVEDIPGDVEMGFGFVSGSMELFIDHGLYRGDITGIAAKDLSGAIYVAAIYSDGTTEWTSGVLGYSIGAYCASQSTKGGTIADLAMATAVYGYHAKQYFG